MITVTASNCCTRVSTPVVHTLTLNARVRTAEAPYALSLLHSLEDNLIADLKLLLKRE